jgi:peptide/nickel transport system substrate-binding protein
VSPGSGTLKARIGAEPDGLDPHKNYGIVPSAINALAYDFLVSWDVATETVIPYIATDWTLGDQKITFTVRNDVTCSDGTPLTADDIAKSMNRAIQLALSLPALASGLNYVWGKDSSPTFVADDATHVTNTWTGTVSSAIALTGLWRYELVCPAGFAADADYNKHSYGSGPFVMTEYTPGVGVNFDVRRDYKWGPRGADATGLPDHFNYLFVANPTTAANLLTTGGLDAGYFTGPDADRLAQDSSLHIITGSSNMARALQLNATEGHPTADKVLRQAITMVISSSDYNIAENGGAQGVPTVSELISTHPCALKDAEKYRATGSLDDAKALLEANGYTYQGDTLTKDGKPIELAFPADAASNAAPQYVTDRLGELGIKVNLDLTDFTTWLPKFTGMTYDITVGQYDNFGPYLQYLAIVTGHGSAGPYTNNPEVGTLLEKALTESGDELCKTVQDIQRSVLENADFVPLDARIVTFASKGWDFKISTSVQLDPTTLHPVDG